MKIVIHCDQVDCRFNKGGVKCSHPSPAITRYPTHIGTVCDSKDRDMTDPNKQPKQIPFGCLNCDSKSDPDYCLNICPIVMVDVSDEITKKDVEETNGKA